MTKPLKQALATLLIFLLATLAFFAGYFIHSDSYSIYPAFLPSTFEGNQERKITDVVNLIENEYVDSIPFDKLNNLAIHSLVENLDPHSSYLEAVETERANESLEGSFEGIGVEFTLLRDTIFVLVPIPGGPSDKAGIKSGDRIISVNGNPVFGKGMTNDSVISKLKGSAGSAVTLALLRGIGRKPYEVKLNRGTIPVKSVETAFMFNDKTAIIKVSHFSNKTIEEFREAASSLLKQGMKNLLLDLRDNPGGVLQAGTGLVNEFLKKGQLIVYTQGRNRPKDEVYADGNGLLQDIGLLVLINENSASASEIVAGALQDHGRAKIAGRKSYGKGLVQEQHLLDDGSSIRLTVARYYTPLGRSIQNPYTMGNLHKNTMDNNWLNDTLTEDSANHKVGGVLPEYVLTRLNSKTLRALNEVYRTDYLAAYCTDWAERNPASSLEIGSIQSALHQLKLSNRMYLDFFKQIHVSTDIMDPQFRAEVEREMRACLLRFYFGREGFYRGLLFTDPEIVSGIKLLN